MKWLAVVLLLMLGWGVAAQPYLEGGKTRHRFAQMYGGIDFRLFPQADGSAPREARLLIGGLHFWGHADFFVAARVATVGNNPLQTRVETGGRYFPWALQHGKLRPFAGVSFQTQVYQAGEGAEVERIRFPLSAGLVYQRKAQLWEVFAQYTSQPGWNEPTGAVQGAWTVLPAWWLGVGWKYTFETTLSAEPDWQSGRTQQVTDILAERGRLNGWTVGIGASSAFFVQDNQTFSAARPTLGKHVFAGVFPEFALGYYWHKSDVQINVVYRSNRSTQEAEDLSHTIRRRALTLEGYHFVGDYHGFAPFVGLTAGVEWLQSSENGQTNGTETLVRPGVVCGWDIRPNRIQSWYLRTNVRWAPGLTVATPDYRFSADQLEINFIQLVIFPGRF